MKDMKIYPIGNIMEEMMGNNNTEDIRKNRTLIITHIYGSFLVLIGYFMGLITTGSNRLPFFRLLILLIIATILASYIMHRIDNLYNIGGGNDEKRT